MKDDDVLKLTGRSNFTDPLGATPFRFAIINRAELFVRSEKERERERVEEGRSSLVGFKVKKWFLGRQRGRGRVMDGGAYRATTVLKRQRESQIGEGPTCFFF